MADNPPDPKSEAQDWNSSVLSPMLKNNVFIDNFSATDEDCDATMSMSSAFQVVVYVMYSVVILTALCGNGLVVYVVTTSPRMRTTTNYWLLNLAVGDILMTLLCIPFSFLATLLLQYWPFGAELCRLVSYSQAVSVLVSAYTLVAISVDRYLAIMWPLRPRHTRRISLVAMLGVWLFALLTALPIPIVSQLSQPDRWHTVCGKSVCLEMWPDSRYRSYYTLALLSLQCFVPLCVLLFTYTKIGIVIWGKRIPGEAENSRDMRMAKAKKKMVAMMIAVVAAFTICWLPFNILVTVWTFNEAMGDLQWLPLLYFACHWLAMSHSCLNPLIYCWMNTRFRQSFKTTLLGLPLLRWLCSAGCCCCCCCCGGVGGSGGGGGASGRLASCSRGPRPPRAHPMARATCTSVLASRCHLPPQRFKPDNNGHYQMAQLSQLQVGTPCLERSM